MTLSLLHSLVSAAYAKGSHHKLALDALKRVRSPHAERWHRLFLKYGKLYLEGAKAPDNEFKDFKNHVLHPRDNYWGGAPAKAQSWYHNLVEALTKNDWDTSAYCAGVLSHYCVDPIQPFHTAQSEAENNIHRAAEWSISKSYNDLRAIGERHTACIVIPVANDANWLAILICQGADRANADYEKLIAHYDITRGVSDPVSGFDDVGRKIVADLIIYAAEMFAIILDRAFAESKIEPPEVSLTAEAFLATANLPLKWFATRMADARERKLVEAMYDELKATGKVEKNLPEDDRVVRDLYATEVLSVRKAPVVAQVFPFQNREKVVTRLERERAAVQLAGPATGRRISAEIVALKPRVAVPTPRPAPARVEAPAIRHRDASRTTERAATATTEPGAAPPAAALVAQAVLATASGLSGGRLQTASIDQRPSRETHGTKTTMTTRMEALPASNLGEIVSTSRDYLEQLRALRDTALTPTIDAIDTAETDHAPTPARPALVASPVQSADRRPTPPPIPSLHAAVSVANASESQTGDRSSSTQSARYSSSAETTSAARMSDRMSSMTVPAATATDTDPSTGPSTAEHGGTQRRTDRSSSTRTSHDWSDYEDHAADERDELDTGSQRDERARSRRSNRTERAPNGPRIYLTVEQDIVDAPSIGPKMAEKLNAVGIDTVGDLLQAHPIALAARLEIKSITPDIVTDWQDQARLVCTIPTLRGTQSQLLVGAGYRTQDMVAEADPEKLCADILNYAISKDGQRILRDGNPPDVEKIKSWVEHARTAKAA